MSGIAVIKYETPGFSETTDNLYKNFYTESARIATNLLSKGILGEASGDSFLPIQGGYLAELTNSCFYHDNGLQNVTSWKNARQEYENNTGFTVKKGESAIISDGVVDKMTELHEAVGTSLKIEMLMVIFTSTFSLMFLVSSIPRVPMFVSNVAIKLGAVSVISLVAKKVLDCIYPPGREAALRVQELVREKNPEWVKGKIL